MVNGLDNLSPAESRFLIEARRRLRDLDPWTRGHFAECLVAELIGADLSRHTAAPHDLEWRVRTPVITIAVRATGDYSLGRSASEPPANGTWTFPAAKLAWDAATKDWQLDGSGKPVARRCHADVAVLCHHHGHDITRDWTFHVLPQQAIEDWPAQSLRPSTLTTAGYPSLTSDRLADAIRTAAS